MTVVYLCPEPLAEAPGYHAPGVGLKGQHGTKTPPKCPPDQETAAAGLDELHAKTCHLVASVVLPRPVDRLEAQEARLHLKERRAESYQCGVKETVGGILQRKRHTIFQGLKEYFDV